MLEAIIIGVGIVTFMCILVGIARIVSGDEL